MMRPTACLSLLKLIQEKLFETYCLTLRSPLVVLKRVGLINFYFTPSFQSALFGSSCVLYSIYVVSAFFFLIVGQFSTPYHEVANVAFLTVISSFIFQGIFWSTCHRYHLNFVFTILRSLATAAFLVNLIAFVHAHSIIPRSEHVASFGKNSIVWLAVATTALLPAWILSNISWFPYMVQSAGELKSSRVIALFLRDLKIWREQRDGLVQLKPQQRPYEQSQPLGDVTQPQLVHYYPVHWQSHSELNHFHDCKCCTDKKNDYHTDEHVPSRNDPEKDAVRDIPPHVLKYRFKRLKLLTEEKLDGTYSSQPKLHVLCETCERLFANLLTFAHNPRSSWLHHPSSQSLEKSAACGCHFCAMIWASLSAQQQGALGLMETRLSERYQEHLASCGDQEQRQEICTQFRKRMSIRIDAQARYLFGRNYLAGEQPRRPPGVQRDIYLTPHFFGYKVPQRCAWSHEPIESNIFKDGGLVPPFVLHWSEWIRDSRHYMTQSLPHIMLAPISRTLNGQRCIIRSWIRGCGKSTNRSTAEIKLPTRLLDVSDFLSSRTVRLRLREEILATEDHDAEYLSLSHCWGIENFERLTSTNFEEFRQGKSVDSLTQTFQDAILVTAKAGVKYIWIDSLCIIQGCRDDWQHEAPLMRFAFEKSACTLAATSAVSGKNGLFNCHDPLIVSPLFIDATKYPTIPLLGCINPADAYRGDKITEIEDSKWNSRAWCFQERLLSQRIIHFGRSQLFLETREDSQSGFTSIIGQYDALHFSDYSGQRVTKARPGTKLLEYSARSWWQLVSSYTRRDLTYGTDKLVAFSGIALKFQELSRLTPPPRYFAGMWIDNLGRELLWYVSYGRQPTRPAEWRAPSWSWASVNGTIWNDSSDELPSKQMNSSRSSAELSLIEIRGSFKPTRQEIVSFPKDSPPETSWFVPENTILRVKGKLQKARWAEMETESYYVGLGAALTEYKGGWDFGGKEELFSYEKLGDFKFKSGTKFGDAHQFVSYEFLDGVKPILDQPFVGPAVCCLLSVEGQRVGWVVPDTSEPLPSDLYCLQIKIEPVEEDDKNDPLSLWVTRGIVLTPTLGFSPEGAEKECFSRVGYFELDRKANGVVWPDAWTGRLREKGLMLPKRQRPDVDPHGFFADSSLEREMLLI